MKFGCHVSIAGKVHLAIDRAIARGCETMQIFSGSPRNWRVTKLDSRDIEIFNLKWAKSEMNPLILHAPYLVNLGSPVREIHEKSIRAMIAAIERAGELGAAYFVFHVGSHGGAGREIGLRRVGEALEKILWETPSGVVVLLENTAGAGFALGSTFQEIRFLLKQLRWSERIGLCLDISHAYAAGYDVSTKRGLEESVSQLEKAIGLDRLKVIHANDSRVSLGSRIDRHENIGEGFIGLSGFRRMVNHPSFADLPFILETPRMNPEDDARNLSIIKGLARS